MEGLLELDETMDVMIISDENEMGQVLQSLDRLCNLVRPKENSHVFCYDMHTRKLFSCLSLSKQANGPLGVATMFVGLCWLYLPTVLICIPRMCILLRCLCQQVFVKLATLA